MRKYLLLAAVLWLTIAPSTASAQPPAPTTPGAPQPTDQIRRNYRVHAGPFYVNPSVLLKELGIDTNVFNEAGEQKSDFTFTISPQADIAIPIARRGLLKTTLGVDGVYYAQYGSERSIDPHVGIRAEGYARNLTVFAGGSYLNTRQRPNHEVDLRSRHLRNNLSGGVAVRITPRLSLEVAKGHTKIRFDGDAFIRGQSLEETLNQTSDQWSVVIRHRRSPLTTLGVRYENVRDRFPLSRDRDSDSFRVMPGAWFQPRALIKGSAFVGYRNFTPRNGLISAYTGLVSQLALSYTLLGATTFGVGYDRDVNYSFEVTTPYFIDNSPSVFVRRALGGQIDVIANAARHQYSYRGLDASSVTNRVDVTDNYGVDVGYRLKRQTRVGFDVSYWTRTSPIDVHNYKGYRIRTTVTYGASL